MSYTRGNVTRRIDYEEWAVVWQPSGGEEDETVVTLMGRHTERQALKAIQAATNSRILRVELLRRFPRWKYMTLAKFAALGDDMEPPVTIDISKED